jgi:D-alanyl-D-alanine dipeptidase
MFASLLMLAMATPAFGQELPHSFVYLRDIDPSILQDIRYSSINNFTGRPVPGYVAAECILLRQVAEALKRVQIDLARLRLSLKIYDGYRPERAVRRFVEWAKDGTDDESTRRFYPHLNKTELFPSGYISSTSSHSRGNAVDLTLVELPARPAAPFDSKRKYGPCTGPSEERAPDNSVDMGTGFDCFDPLSHTTNQNVSYEQQQWRRLLVSIMEQHQFKNYSGEWWHFTYPMPNSSTLKTYDFPIVSRSASQTRP